MSKGKRKDKDKETKAEAEAPTSPAPLEQRSLLQRLRLPILIYLICLGGYLGASGTRLKRHSGDNHYVYLAQGLLEGRLALKGNPPHQNDWALLYTLELKDGRTVRGAYLRTGGQHIFKTTTGERLHIPPQQVKRRRHTYYVSFPWFPAILMLPFVAIWGLKFNDVIFNVVVGAFNPVLVFWLLQRLVKLGYSERSLSENLWLTGMFAFGTVHFYSTVIGQVWYTAHVVGVALTALYALAALEGRHLYLAGLCLGLGFVTRTPIPFSVGLVAGEVLRRHLLPPAADAPAPDPHRRPPLFQWIAALWPRVQLKPAFVDMLKVALPIVLVAGVAMVLNSMRFDNPAEFGHTYLNVKWAERIQRWGLFNYHFLSRNLAVMLFMLPRFSAKAPHIKISWHGVGLPVTTPLFCYLLWPRRRSPLAPWLLAAVLGPMLIHLLYQNSGWVQFGYRFSLDYAVYLVALLALGGHRIGLFAKALILFGVGVNTFGAITFGRMWQYYWNGYFPVP